VHVDHLEENFTAAALELSGDDLRRIDSAVPPAAGERYHPAGMSVIDR
jgi:diketogulonate reductase-like aldo/keto reductase